jgi:hypothetical protein
MVLAACILMPLRLASQTIEGRVTNAVTGNGIPGVKVGIFPADGPPANGYSIATDAQGGFRIESVKGGAYRAIYSAAGFSPVPAPGDLPAAFPVGNGAEPVRLDVKLQPLATISGRVLDATGKHVPNASIWLIRQETWCMPPECHPDHRDSKSDENGVFTIRDLPPGPWLVAATAPPSWGPPQPRGDERLGWAQTFYPGVIDPQLAEAVMLRPGGQQWTADIKLAAVSVHRIVGRLLDPDGEPVPKASVMWSKGFGPTLTQETKAGGAFDFAVVDDQWILSASVDRSGVKLKSTRTVDVKDRDAEGVEMRLSAPFTLQGKIVMQAPDGVPAPEPPPIDMGLVPVTPVLSDGPDVFLVVRMDGESLTVPDVYPGSYRLQFLTDSPAPYFLDSIRLGEQDAFGTFSVVSPALPLTITFRLGGGTVRGTLDACGSHHVFLVPQEPALRRDGFIRITGCDSNGHFEFPAVRPGEYYGIAMAKEPRSFADLSNDNVLSQGNKVTVRANESTSAAVRLVER